MTRLTDDEKQRRREIVKRWREAGCPYDYINTYCFHAAVPKHTLRLAIKWVQATERRGGGQCEGPIVASVEARGGYWPSGICKTNIARRTLDDRPRTP